MIRPRGLRTVASLLLAGAALTVSACTPASETWEALTVDGVHVPEIHWPNGAPHPKDPWAQALVEAKIIEAAAFNDLDLSPIALRHHLSDDWLAYVEQRAASSTTSSDRPSSLGYKYNPGPLPMRIAKVRQHGQDRATVTACELPSFLWTRNDREPVTLDQLEALIDHDDRQNMLGTAVEHTMIRDPDGRIKYDRVHSTTGPCPLTTIQAGFFQPQPDFGRVVLRDELTLTDGSTAAWWSGSVDDLLPAQKNARNNPAPAP